MYTIKQIKICAENWDTGLGWICQVHQDPDKPVFAWVACLGILHRYLLICI